MFTKNYFSWKGAPVKLLGMRAYKHSILMYSLLILVMFLRWIFYLGDWLYLIQSKSMLADRTVTVDVGKSQPRSLISMFFFVFFLLSKCLPNAAQILSSKSCCLNHNSQISLLTSKDYNINQDKTWTLHSTKSDLNHLSYFILTFIDSNFRVTCKVLDHNIENWTICWILKFIAMNVIKTLNLGPSCIGLFLFWAYFMKTCKKI